MAGNVYDPAGVLTRMPKQQTFDLGAGTIPTDWNISQGVPSGYKATWQANPNGYGPGMATGSTKGNQMGDYQLQPLQPGENPAYDVYQGQQRANAANEQRYQDTLKLLGDTYAGAMGLEQQRSLEPQLYDENLRYNNQSGALKNNLLSRGLYNSTLLNSQQQGLDRTHSINNANIQNQALDRLINLLTQGGTSKARVMEGKIDQGPDANAAMAAFDQAGAMGGAGGNDGGKQQLGGWKNGAGVSDQTMWELNNLPPNQWSKQTVAEGSKWYGGYPQLKADYDRTHGGAGQLQLQSPGQVATGPNSGTLTLGGNGIFGETSASPTQSSQEYPNYDEDGTNWTDPNYGQSWITQDTGEDQPANWMQGQSDNWWDEYGYNSEEDFYNDYFPGWDEGAADAP